MVVRTILINRRIFIFAVFLAIQSLAFGQSNLLVNKITLSVTQATLEEVLLMISEKGEFNFSYNADVINGDSLVSLKVRNKSVEKALNQLFGESVRYKVIGDHIVLLPETNKNNNKSSKRNLGTGGYTITGYIFDAKTGQTLENATVYEVNGKISGISNRQGFYSIIVPSDRELKGLNYCRYNYHDTIILIRPQSSIQLDITLRPRQFELQKIQSKALVLEHDIHERNIVNLFVPDKAQINAQNLNVYEKTSVQFSILPFIGSNAMLSGTKTNTVSLNLFAGYTGSIDGLEVGGFLNVVRNNVNGVQLSGFGNVVGEETEGVQAAGFFNINAGNLTGAQLAGFQNTLNGEMHGVQASGFNNVTTQNVDGVQLTGFLNVAFKDVELAQAAGFANYARDVNGIQLAGFGNMAFGNVEAAQVAGFMNIANDVNGAQLAGYVNFAAGNVDAVQAAGFLNFAKNVNSVQLAGFSNFTLGNVGKAQLAGFTNYSTSNNGIQISGFTNVTLGESTGFQITSMVNYAGILNGYQIAILNFADSVESGTPIGLFSYVRKGYHTIELSTNEILFGNMAFRTGTTKFYNIFKAGMGYNNLIHPAYGVGTLKKFKELHSLGFEFVAGPTLDRKADDKVKGALVDFGINYGYDISDKINFSIGPTLKIYSAIGKSDDEYYEIAPYTLHEQVSDEFRNQAWVGLTAGFRFL